MYVGYVRVSSVEQNEARQVEALTKYGCTKLFIDKKSGKDIDRKEFKAMMNFVREGDALVVTELSRLSRNLSDLIATVNTLVENKVTVIFIKENIRVDNDNNASGRLMLNLFACLAQYEREMIRERQQEGIEIAKQAGKYKGGKCKQFDENVFNEVMELLASGQITVTEAGRRLGVTRATVYNILKRYNAKEYKQNK